MTSVQACWDHLAECLDTSVYITFLTLFATFLFAAIPKICHVLAVSWRRIPICLVHFPFLPPFHQFLHLFSHKFFFLLCFILLLVLLRGSFPTWPPKSSTFIPTNFIFLSVRNCCLHLMGQKGLPEIPPSSVNLFSKVYTRLMFHTW